MKKLKLFAPFNAELFFSNIDLQFVKLEEVYTDGIKSGFKYHLLIIADNNNYGDDSSLNMGELIKVKVDNNKCNIDFANDIFKIIKQYPNLCSRKYLP